MTILLNNKSRKFQFGLKLFGRYKVAIMSDLESLISMGFSKQQAEEALIETNNAGIELAIEWLIITEGNSTTTKEDKDYTKAEIASLGDQQFNFNIEKAVRESLKETEMPCQTVESSEAVRESLKETKVSCVPIESSKPSEIAGNESTTRILVRLLDGKTLSKVFKTRENLNAVVVWIQSQINTEQFGLMTNFPKKVFTTEDYQLSLDALKLVPSAVVIVAQLEKWDNLKVYHGPKNDDESQKLEEKRRKEEVEKQCKKMEEERLALERVRAQIKDDKAARKLRWPNLYQNSDKPS